MNGQLADEMTRLLEEAFAGRLQGGERISVETIEVCSNCQRDVLAAEDRCSTCGGKAWVTRQVTLRTDDTCDASSG